MADGEVLDAEFISHLTDLIEPKPRVDPLPRQVEKYDWVKAIAQSYLPPDAYAASLRRADLVEKLAFETQLLIEKSGEELNRFSQVLPGYPIGEAVWVLRFAAMLVNVAPRVDRGALTARLSERIILMDVDLALWLVDNMYADAETLGMFLLACRCLSDAQVIVVGGDPRHICTRAGMVEYGGESTTSNIETLTA